MGDPRAKYFARLGRVRRSARRWSVTAGALVTATAVLLPYGGGIGIADAFWAASAGGSIALAFWRWSDLRMLAAQPPPPALDPTQRAQHNQKRIEAVVGRLPIGRTALTEIHRVAHLSRVRGSVVAGPAARLDRSTKAFAGLVPRLTGPAYEVVDEAAAAEHALRDLAERIATVERANRAAGASGAPGAPINAMLLERFTGGVGSYEGLVAAAASYVAEDGRFGESMAIGRLIEAGDRLRGIAEGMSNMPNPRPY